jgi:hypothetical protein
VSGLQANVSREPNRDPRKDINCGGSINTLEIVCLAPPSAGLRSAGRGGSRPRHIVGRNATGTFRGRFLFLGIAFAKAMLLVPSVWKRLCD